MKTISPANPEHIRDRKALIRKNLFSRMPTVNAATRMQGTRLLRAVSDLSSLEWRILWDLVETGPMTVRDLADVHQFDHSLLSRALPEMRRKGYVTVARNPDDGRQSIVSVAPKGHEEYERAAPTMARRRAALHGLFSADELESFIDMMDRLDAFVRNPIEDLVVQPEPAK